MHIKTVNTHSKYECIVMRGNDKGRAVNRLSCSGVLPGADGVYPSSDRSHPENFSPLLFGLILAIGRSPKYKIDGWPGARGMLNINNDPISYGSNCYPAGWLSNISSEVPNLNQFFHKKYQALAVVGFMAMVPMIITPQGSVALVRGHPHRWGPLEIGEVPDKG